MENEFTRGHTHGSDSLSLSLSVFFIFSSLSVVSIYFHLESILIIKDEVEECSSIHVIGSRRWITPTEKRLPIGNSTDLLSLLYALYLFSC